MTRTFTVTTLVAGAPTLVAPEDNAFLNIRRPLFEWAASTGIGVDYRLQVIKSGDNFQGPFVINLGDIIETQFQAIGNLADTTYRWRVIARDAALNTATSVSRTFAVDTIPPTEPGNLTEATTGGEQVRIFTWVRSVDTVPLTTGTTGDESGVDFYKIVITGAQQVITTADDTDTLCPQNLCEFSTPQLTPGGYTIQVKAVDRATNESSTATADFRAGALGIVQNLAVVDPVFVDPVVLVGTVNTPNPKFRWKPPLDLPSGLSTYEVAITSDATLPPGSQFNIPFTPFTDTNFFTTECFDGTGDAIGTGDQCTIALAETDVIRITVKVVVPDGTHLLRVRVIPAAGVPGDSGSPYLHRRHRSSGRPNAGGP